MVKARFLLLILLALLALLAGRAWRHQQPHLPLTAGSWTASQTGNTYVEAGVNRDDHAALVFAPGAATLRLSGNPEKLPAGKTITLHATFDDTASYAFTGTGIGGSVQAPIDPATLAPFTQHLAHGGSSVVFSFDDQQNPPLAFQLAGAATTLAALTQAMDHAGIVAPWTGVAVNNRWPVAPGMMAGALGLSVGWFFTVVALLYFLPAVIAYTRGSASRGILLFLNLILGWTVIVWWVLLVAAVVSPVRPPRQLRRI